MSVIWKAKEVEILKQMLDANKTPQEVAQVLKSRTLDGIRNKVSKMGWQWAFEPEFDMDAFRKIMRGK
jgi:hypothetical protein